MNHLQETEYRLRQGRASYMLFEWIEKCEPDVYDFAEIVNEVMDEFYRDEDSKRRFNKLAHQPLDLIVNDCHPTTRMIADALQPSVDVNQFAKHIAEVLRNEYGGQNFKPFISSLLNELLDDTTR